MNRMSKQTNAKRFCKVCKDSGKSEEEYMSHFVRATTDPNSAVVCPTLLSMRCRFCDRNGHTINYCNEKILQQRRIEKNQRREILAEKPAKKEKKVKGFQALCDSTSEDEVVKSAPKQTKAKVKEDFPQLNPSEMKRLETKPLISFADVARKTHEEQEKERLALEQATWLSTLKEFKSKKAAVSVTVAPVFQPEQVRKVPVNWADDFSSDEEIKPKQSKFPARWADAVSSDEE